MTDQSGHVKASTDYCNNQWGIQTQMSSEAKKKKKSSVNELYNLYKKNRVRKQW